MDNRSLALLPLIHLPKILKSKQNYQRLLKCTFCGYKTRKESSLRRHLKHYSCSYCDFKTCIVEPLLKHIQRKHIAELRDSDEEVFSDADIRSVKTEKEDILSCEAGKQYCFICALFIAGDQFVFAQHQESHLEEINRIKQEHYEDDKTVFGFHKQNGDLKKLNVSRNTRLAKPLFKQTQQKHFSKLRVSGKEVIADADVLSIKSEKEETVSSEAKQHYCFICALFITGDHAVFTQHEQNHLEEINVIKQEHFEDNTTIFGCHKQKADFENNAIKQKEISDLQGSLTKINHDKSFNKKCECFFCGHIASSIANLDKHYAKEHYDPDEIKPKTLDDPTHDSGFSEKINQTLQNGNKISSDIEESWPSDLATVNSYSSLNSGPDVINVEMDKKSKETETQNYSAQTKEKFGSQSLKEIKSKRRKVYSENEGCVRPEINNAKKLLKPKKTTSKKHLAESKEKMEIQSEIKPKQRKLFSRNGSTSRSQNNTRTRKKTKDKTLNYRQETKKLTFPEEDTLLPDLYCTEAVPESQNNYKIVLNNDQIPRNNLPQAYELLKVICEQNAIVIN